MNEWIKNLKVGDLVVVSSRTFAAVRKVEKITPSGLIKVNGILYNNNGCERGGDICSRNYLREATPELIDEIRIKSTIRKAYNLMQSAKNITFEQATEIIKILSPQEQENIT